MSKTESGISGVYDVRTFVINSDTLSNENPLRWKQILMGGNSWEEKIRLNRDSVAYMNVSVDRKEILVYGDRVNLATKEQEIYNELGLSENTYMNMDSILVARQLKSRFQFELTDSITLMVKGRINNDSIFITAKKRPIEIKDFRLIKNGFHWITE